MWVFSVELSFSIIMAIMNFDLSLSPSALWDTGLFPIAPYTSLSMPLIW